MQGDVYLILVAAQDLVQDPSSRLGTMRQMNQPLLVPHPIKSPGGSFSLRGSIIRAAKGAEAILRPGADVGVAGVHGCLQSA